MSKVKFSVIKRKNPQDPTADGKFYPIVKSYGCISKEDVIERAVLNSNIDQAVIESVMVGMGEAFENFLLNGHNIQAWPLGSFNVRVSSNIYASTEELEKAGVDAAVRKIRIRYLPSPSLKNELKKLKFEKTV